MASEHPYEHPYAITDLIILSDYSYQIMYIVCASIYLMTVNSLVFVGINFYCLLRMLIQLYILGNGFCFLPRRFKHHQQLLLIMNPCIQEAPKILNSQYIINHTDIYKIIHTTNLCKELALSRN
ncbi:hypothetical protein CHS0354_036137 [Potamilus streckersoni]|uniref:Uncharacterized protein n=1 Tax=Potamilus streckersoni TaxID=2493646 RepID=A0AAE0W7M3_9BIVA|nr:hypothetical protein CHS0354_036137 [Potamilus streckersoni]